MSSIDPQRATRTWSKRFFPLVFVLVGWIGGACRPSDPGQETVFATPELAAQAFSSNDLPTTQAWDPRDGTCRILMVGDSLMAAVVRSQEAAIRFMGCEGIVDGLVGRSLTNGWQCSSSSHGVTIRADPEPGNSTCRPSGLELLDEWSEFARSASVVVIALGTNDAAVMSQDLWTRRWVAALDLTTGPVMFVTAAARPGHPWADKVLAYNEALRLWCADEPRCSLADWAQTEPALDTNSYVDYVHLTREVGEMRAVFLAVKARQVAIPAPPGPDRWKAPPPKIVPRPTSTTGESSDSSSNVPVGSNSVPLVTSWPSTPTFPSPTYSPPSYPPALPSTPSDSNESTTSIPGPVPPT